MHRPTAEPCLTSRWSKSESSAYGHGPTGEAPGPLQDPAVLRRAERWLRAGAIPVWLRDLPYHPRIYARRLAAEWVAIGGVV